MSMVMSMECNFLVDLFLQFVFGGSTVEGGNVASCHPFSFCPGFDLNSSSPSAPPGFYLLLSASFCHRGLNGFDSRSQYDVIDAPITRRFPTRGSRRVIITLKGLLILASSAISPSLLPLPLSLSLSYTLSLSLFLFLPVRLFTHELCACSHGHDEVFVAKHLRGAPREQVRGPLLRHLHFAVGTVVLHTELSRTKRVVLSTIILSILSIIILLLVLVVVVFVVDSIGSEVSG